MKNNMTVKELRELLAKFDDNMEIEVTGGESEYGEYAELNVGHTKVETHYRKDGSTYTMNTFKVEETIMAY